MLTSTPHVHGSASGALPADENLDVELIQGSIETVFGKFVPQQADAGPGSCSWRLEAVRLVLVDLQRAKGKPRSEHLVNSVLLVDLHLSLDTNGTALACGGKGRGVAIRWQRNERHCRDDSMAVADDVATAMAFTRQIDLFPAKGNPIVNGKWGCGIWGEPRTVKSLLLIRQEVQLAAPKATVPDYEQSTMAAQAALDNVGLISALLASVAIGTYFVISLNQTSLEGVAFTSFLDQQLVTAFLILNAMALFSALAAIIIVGMTPMLVALRKSQLTAIQEELEQNPQHYFLHIAKLAGWQRHIFLCMRDSLAWSLSFMLASILSFAAAATLVGFNQLASNQLAMWLFPACALFVLLMLCAWLWHSCVCLQFDLTLKFKPNRSRKPCAAPLAATDKSCGSADSIDAMP